jgi:hypothetical protein
MLRSGPDAHARRAAIRQHGEVAVLNFGRTSVFLLIGLTVVYVSLYLYFRSGIRMKLEDDWVMEGRPGDRNAWVDDRLEPRAARLRRWLVLLVYVIPILGLSIFVYLTN